MIPKIFPQKSQQKAAKLYSPTHEFIAKIKTDYELNDVRIKIKDNKAIGYCLMFEGFKINIDEYGMVDCWPDGFFRETTDQLNYLLLGYK